MNIFESMLHAICKLIWGVNESKIPLGFSPKRILIVRPHNQLGDMIAGTVLFRALKENYPHTSLYLLASPMNISGASRNPFLSGIFNFDKKLLFNFKYLSSLYKFLRTDYDLLISPVVVSISFTSNLFSGIARAKYKIGPAFLDNKINASSYFFNVRVPLDFRSIPKEQVWKRIMHNVAPLKLPERELRTDITPTDAESAEAASFLTKNGYATGQLLVGLHPGAGKPPNIWSDNNFVEVINALSKSRVIFFYATGSASEIDLLNSIKNRLNVPLHLYIGRAIGEVAALISRSDLFISNDTGIMHVAGSTSVPQISLFGMTDPDVWAPPGENKIALRESENINDIPAGKVIDLAKDLLKL